MNQMTSDGEDCGIEGKEDSPVLTGPFNRFARRTRHVHIDPLHKAVNEHGEWISDAKIIFAEIRGGVKVIKFLAAGLFAAFVGGFVFAFNLWQKISSLPGAH